MRCSSSNAAFDEFLDGTLSAVRRARLQTHLARCAACAEVLAELRVVDALLLTPRQLEPAANFSFRVMAEIRAMPAPHVAPTRHLATLATYVIFAWAAIGGFLAFGGNSSRAAVAFLGRIGTHTASEFGILAMASGRLFGQHWIDVTAAMGALLALDLVCVGIFIATFAIVRARRGAAVTEPW